MGKVVFEQVPMGTLCTLRYYRYFSKDGTVLRVHFVYYSKNGTVGELWEHYVYSGTIGTSALCTVLCKSLDRETFEFPIDQ